MATPWKLQAGAAGVSLILISLLVLRVSAAAFTATTENPGNSWATGSITLSDDDGANVAMFDVTGMLPGQNETRCITVTYTGDADPAVVKLYTDVTDGGLGPHLDVTVREVTQTGGSGSTCGTLSDPTVIVNNVTLNAFATAHADYSNGAGTWDPSASGQTKTYEFSVTLGSDTPGTAQGGDAQATFTWETTA